MRRIVLMRHAKSSWKSEAKTDHERPLNARGRRDAPRVAKAIQAQGWMPDVVVSSDATRTKETFEGMKDQWSNLVPVVFSRRLYLSGVEEAVEVLKETQDQHNTLLLLGHNPDWELLLTHLCREMHSLKTANAALLEATKNGSWSELLQKPGRFRLHSLIRARDLA